MSRITLGTRAPGRAGEAWAPEEGAFIVRDAPSRPTAAGSVPDRGRRADAVKTGRVLASTLAVYLFLIAFPLLAMIPVFLVGLFLGAFTLLFGGIS